MPRRRVIETEAPLVTQEAIIDYLARQNKELISMHTLVSAVCADFRKPHHKAVRKELETLEMLGVAWYVQVMGGSVICDLQQLRRVYPELPPPIPSIPLPTTAPRTKLPAISSERLIHWLRLCGTDRKKNPDLPITIPPDGVVFVKLSRFVPMCFPGQRTKPYYDAVKATVVRLSSRGWCGLTDYGSGTVWFDVRRLP